MSDAPFVSLIIPVFNEELHIADCLSSLLDQDGYPRDRLEVLIVDGRSTDHTRNVIELIFSMIHRTYPDMPLRLLDNAKRLQSAAFNIAMREADPRATVLMRCDAHAKYPPEFITNAVKALQGSPSTAASVYGDAPISETCFQAAVAFAQNTRVGVGGALYRLGKYSAYVDHGKHGCFWRHAVEEVGGYDETFSHNEDSELSHRLLQAGYKIWLDRSLTVGYHPRRTPKALARQYWLYGRGRAKNVRKHKMRLAYRQMAPIALALLSPLLLVGGFFSHWLWLPLALYLLIIIGASTIGAIQRQEPCVLLAPVALAIMHYTWGAGYASTWLKK